MPKALGPVPRKGVDAGKTMVKPPIKSIQQPSLGVEIGSGGLSSPKATRPVKSVPLRVHLVLGLFLPVSVPWLPCGKHPSLPHPYTAITSASPQAQSDEASRAWLEPSETLNQSKCFLF